MIFIRKINFFSDDNQYIFFLINLNKKQTFDKADLMFNEFCFMQFLLVLSLSSRIQFMKNILISSNAYVIMNYSMPSAISSYDESLITQSIEFRLVNNFIIINIRIDFRELQEILPNLMCLL